MQEEKKLNHQPKITIDIKEEEGRKNFDVGRGKGGLGRKYLFQEKGKRGKG